MRLLLIRGIAHVGTAQTPNSSPTLCAQHPLTSPRGSSSVFCARATSTMPSARRPCPRIFYSIFGDPATAARRRTSRRRPEDLFLIFG
ncbi:hypothetical protein B0H15DRAFT_862115, partial [Mycena belliarum]